jgi:hypothetical protein
MKELRRAVAVSEQRRNSFWGLRLPTIDMRGPRVAKAQP